MRDELKIFDNPEFGPVRVIMIDGELWFVGKDVAEALGYKNTRDALTKHVDEEDKNTVVIRDGIQGNPYKSIINESGMYALIFGSKLPSAKCFKHWVTSEVLPAIRKTGTYTNQNIYKIKETSLGEITSFVREMDKVMRDQNSCPYEIAEAFQGICTQFGIQLPENFVNRGVEPVHYITLEEIYNTPDEDEEEDCHD